MINEMYVFIEGSNFPAGIFTTLDNAKEWIEKYSLSGILNKYRFLKLKVLQLHEGFLAQNFNRFNNVELY
jgi:hypothetical protein